MNNPNNSDDKNIPTKEQLLANNRESRLAKGWAHKCPKCNRQYTTFNGLKTHGMEKHNIQFVIGD